MLIDDAKILLIGAVPSKHKSRAKDAYSVITIHSLQIQASLISSTIRMACTAAAVATIVDCVAAGWPTIWDYGNEWYGQATAISHNRQDYSTGKTSIAKCAAATGKWW